MAFDGINFLTEKINNSPEMQKWINTGIKLLNLPPQPAQNPLQNFQQPPQPQPPKIDLNADTANNIIQAQQAVKEQRENKNPLVPIPSADVPDRNADMGGFLIGLNTNSMTSQQLQDLQTLYGLKQHYALADKVLAEGNLNDKQKNFWLGQKNDSANAAAMIRRSAVANGFNPDDYGLGSGNTLEQSSQALHYLQNRDMKNFLDLKSANEKATEKYNELRAQGVEPYRANYLANQEFGANRQDVLNQLSNALDTYGINSDGSYNKYYKTPDGKVEFAKRLAKLNGLKEGTQEFNDYVLTMSSVNKLPTIDEHKQSANKLGNSFLFLQDSLYSGNIEKLKEEIQQMRDELKNPESDFKKQFTPYETWEAIKLLDLYEEAAEGKIGVRELGDKSYALLHPNWKPDPSDFDREPVWYWDMDEQLRKKYIEAENRESLKQRHTPSPFSGISVNPNTNNTSPYYGYYGSSLGETGSNPYAAYPGYGAIQPLR